MTTDYEAIFRHRGDSYHEAMLRFPGVRREEFLNLFTHFPLKGSEHIADCPSLGGYLSENVREAGNVTNLDFCPLEDSIQAVHDYQIPYEGCVDRFVCLAASHHINDMGKFAASASRSLKEGGLFHLADVDSRNPVRLFLDNFVGKWTSTGHQGIWRDFFELSCEIETCTDLSVKNIREVCCPWEFRYQNEMVEFCRLLFGLDKNPSDDQILHALDEYVGVYFTPSKVIVSWKLTYIDFCKHGDTL